MANNRTIKRRERRKRKKALAMQQKAERPLLDPETAFAIVDDDMPDGAYWAMMEELTGMEPGDLVDDD